MKKPTANEIIFWRSGTAEIKLYSRNAKKFFKKLEYILLHQYVFTFTAQKMAVAIGQQRSVSKLLGVDDGGQGDETAHLEIWNSWE